MFKTKERWWRQPLGVLTWILGKRRPVEKMPGQTAPAPPSIPRLESEAIRMHYAARLETLAANPAYETNPAWQQIRDVRDLLAQITHLRAGIIKIQREL